MSAGRDGSGSPPIGAAAQSNATTGVQCVQVDSLGSLCGACVVAARLAAVSSMETHSFEPRDEDFQSRARRSEEIVDGQIFISYRRDDSLGSTGRLYDHLEAKFGSDKVFIDVASIEPGVDFIDLVERTLPTCDVLIVVIGRRWLLPEGDGPRINDPDDLVRLEIETALRSNLRVIPVLVEGAQMPKASTLPDDLKPLARRNATEISHTRFDADARDLVSVIQRALDGAASARQVTEAAAARVPESPDVVERDRHTEGATDDAPSAPAVLRAHAPEPLPDPPPIPQSYQDRFADVFAPTLNLDSQQSLFARLRYDFENGINKIEATALLRRLNERADLSWKISEEISSLLAAAPVENSPPPARGASSPTTWEHEPPPANPSIGHVSVRPDAEAFTSGSDVTLPVVRVKSRTRTVLDCQVFLSDCKFHLRHMYRFYGESFTIQMEESPGWSCTVLRDCTFISDSVPWYFWAYELASRNARHVVVYSYLKAVSINYVLFVDGIILHQDGKAPPADLHEVITAAMGTAAASVLESPGVVERDGPTEGWADDARNDPSVSPDAPVVFICHANEDAAAALEIAVGLRAAGIGVWLDEDRVRSGEDWNDRVEHILEQEVQYVAVLQSAAMLHKDVGHVNKEINLALQRNDHLRPPRVFLIPVIIDDPANRLDTLSHLQSVNVAPPAGVAPLVRAIRRDLDVQMRGTR